MGFFQALLDDAQKNVNPAHVITFMLVIAVVVWGSWEVYHTNHMPTNLDGAAFLLGGAAGVNGAHKLEDIIAKFKGGQ